MAYYLITLCDGCLCALREPTQSPPYFGVDYVCSREWRIVHDTPTIRDDLPEVRDEVQESDKD